MQRTLNLTILLAVAVLVIFTGCGDAKDAADGHAPHAGFAQTMSMADSLYSTMHFRDAYDLYLQLLDDEEVKADKEKRLSVLNALCTTSELSGHQTEENKWLQQLLELAMKTGNDYYHSLGHLAMGQNLFYEGNHEKGIENVIEAVRLIVKTDREDADHLMHSHLIMLARLYGEMKDYDNALKTDEHNLQLTMKGTRWGHAPNQQLIDRRMALAKLAALLARMKNYQRADSAYAAWKAVQYEGNHTRDYFIVDYMKQRGRYQEAIPIYNNLIERVRQQGDTLGEMMNTAKWGLAEIYRKMGYCSQAVELYEQVLEIQATLKSRKAINTAQELAAIYHAQEQEQTIMQQEAENTIQEAIILVVIIVLMAVTALTVVVIRKNRVINRKNRALAQQIADAVRYRERYQQEKNANAPKTDVADLNALSDEELFQYIDDIVISERLFTNPNFGRDAIMERFQLSKERVGAAFSKGSKHAKMSSYVLQLRLEHAAHQLVEQPHRTVVDIATDCGFSSNTYFSSRFRQHFGISPTDYRIEAAGNRED